MDFLTTEETFRPTTRWEGEIRGRSDASQFDSAAVEGHKNDLDNRVVA